MLGRGNGLGGAGDVEIVAEAHHRVKNTLQNIISYINVMFASREQVSREDLHKLTRYIHSLSVIHDVLLREVQGSGSGKQVRIDRIIQDMVELNGAEMALTLEEVPACVTTTRRAATLSLVLNELLDNCRRYGKGEATIGCELEDPSLLRIVVKNRAESGKADFIFGNGLRISSLLAQKDLQSNLIVSVKNGRVAVGFSVPIEVL